MAAISHDDAVMLDQVDVATKTNETPMFTELLDRIEVAGSVVTADTRHVQRTHADYLHRRRADFVLTVRANQPSLCDQLRRLPWAHGQPH